MRIGAAILWTSVAVGALVACNFIVDAQFDGKKFPGQDGSTVVGDCPLGNSPKDPGCSNCMLSVCRNEFSAICKDGTNAQGKQYLNACVDDPSVKQGECERVFIDASAPQSFDDPTTHWFNMRVCVTQKCKAQCTTCPGLTYDRYAGDNMPPPLTAAVSTCAACLVGKCSSILVGGGSQFSHCCYQDRVDDTWGPCVRPSSPDCMGIKTWAAMDGGSSSCNHDLAKCALDNCTSDCNL